MDIRVYSAAIYSNGYMSGQQRYRKLNEREREVVSDLPYVLESYHYVGKDKIVREMRANGAKIFLDSGAFSAHTLGIDLSLEEYCNYIKRNIDIIKVDDGALMASVLDAIGDAHKTYENQLAMESLGVRPMPTFHAGEDPRYLDWYVANYDYMSLGGMVGSNTQQLEIWLDRMWENHLLDGAGNPKIRVHGFGITSVPLMERYQWWSCDSSSWIQSAAFGSIILPGLNKNKSFPLNVSTGSPDAQVAGNHIATLTPVERERVLNYLHSLGFDEQRLGDVYESRAVFNLYAFREMNRLMNQDRSTARKPLRLELF